MAKRANSGPPAAIGNSKAHRNYHIETKFEAGIELLGTEVKSIRAGHASIAESHVRITKGIPTLYNASINAYAHGEPHELLRPRRLLLHKKEILKLKTAFEADGKSIVPLRLYFKKALIKLEIATAIGKKQHDKRETLKRKTQLREAARELSDHRRAQP